MSDLARALAGVVGDGHVLVDDDLRAGFEVDWTGRFRGRALAVVRPGTTEEVAKVLARCHEAGAPVVPQGGNTGLVGGGVPLAGEVVLSLRRLAGLEPVDRAAAQVTVGAGATLADVARHARGAGLDVGIDLASRDSATVGGMVATNAGGVRALRYGMMRAQVAGVEAVLADGRVLRRLGGLRDNAGADLAALLSGSEGTLAVMTRVRLRLVPLLRRRVTALLAFPALEPALAFLGDVRSRLFGLEAAEGFFGDGAALVQERLGVRPPFPTGHPFYLLVEWAGDDDGAGSALAAFSDAAGEALDAAVATEPGPRAALWRLREGHSEAIATVGVPHKLDVAVPLGRLGEFAGRVRSTVAARAPGAACYLFGHVGEGSLHVNVVGPAVTDEVDEAVLALAAEVGGSISAEHGIGTAKRRWLHLARSPGEVAVLRSLKSALDPGGILNPNALVPPLP